MSGEIEAIWRGIDECKERLRGLPDKLRRRVLRNALAAGARIVRDEARRATPVLREPHPYRKPGTVRDAIKVRTSKNAKAAGDVGVFVNVQPLKGKAVRAFKARTGLGGGKNPDDPFYWRWLNFGRQGRAAAPARAARSGVRGLIRAVRSRRARRAVGPMPAARFLERGAERLNDALKKFSEVLGPALQRILDRKSED